MFVWWYEPQKQSPLPLIMTTPPDSRWLSDCAPVLMGICVFQPRKLHCFHKFRRRVIPCIPGTPFKNRRVYKRAENSSMPFPIYVWLVKWQEVFTFHFTQSWTTSFPSNMKMMCGFVSPTGHYLFQVTINLIYIMYDKAHGAHYRILDIQRVSWKHFRPIFFRQIHSLITEESCMWLPTRGPISLLVGSILKLRGIIFDF